MSGLSRRRFVQASAGLTFALALPGGLAGSGRIARARGIEPGAIGAWVTIGSDDSVVIASPVAEMGQGSLTGIAMIFAEELDADWARVSTRTAPIDVETFGNPMTAEMSTYGSWSVRGYWDMVRLQGAAARRLLMQEAAAHWQVPLDSVTTEAGVVVHRASGRRLSYGEVAAFAESPDALPEVGLDDLKRPDEYRIVGQSTQRLDVASKVDGSQPFSFDVRLPDMVYATILRSPVFQSQPLLVDDAAALAQPDVLRVVKLDKAVGVVARTMEAALAASRMVEVTWSEVEGSTYNSDVALEAFATAAADLSQPGLDSHAIGDVDATLASSARRLAASYSSDHVVHAQMEPLNVTARVDADGKGAEIWIACQSFQNPQTVAASMLGTTPDRIIVHQHMLGGGFGRRTQADQLPEALALARALGRPVKLLWSREQDLGASYMRPLTGHYLEAGLDGDGSLAAWRHRVAAESPMALISPDFPIDHVADFIVMMEADENYAIPNRQCSFVRQHGGMKVNPWRGVGAGHNVFAREAFLDEVLAAQGKDPLSGRIELLSEEPRAQAVLRAVAERAEWGRSLPGDRALGLSYSVSVGTHVAAVADVELNRANGDVTVHKVWIALDPGIVINPDSALAQTEGNIMWGVSAALKESMPIHEGRAMRSNYHDYQVARMADMPEMDIQLLPTDNPPKGMGEAAIPHVAPAIANALATITGVRFRQLPMSPQRILAGLAEA